jgi:multicomponent Na+:H+ antiporter subunit G
MIAVISGVFMITGAVLAVLAGAGLHRFEDVFARMHAATKPATLGLALVLVGAALQMPDAGSIVKLLLVVLLQFITAPVGSHLVGRAAYRAGTEMNPDTRPDELAQDQAVT